jgi:hypothetical protein
MFTTELYGIDVGIPGKNWQQEMRCSSRGNVYLFAPMVGFNIMAEVGDNPP